MRKTAGDSGWLVGSVVSCWVTNERGPMIKAAKLQSKGEQFSDSFREVRKRMSAALIDSLIPLFSNGASSRSVPLYEGTAFCVEAEGFRFLATAKHVLNNLDGILVRDSQQKIVPLTDFQIVDLPDVDVALVEIGFSHTCKHLKPLHTSPDGRLSTKPGDLLYLEGYPASLNKLPHKKGLKPMGIPVYALPDDPTKNCLRFTLDRGNYVDLDGEGVEKIPSLNGMSGSPVFPIQLPQATGQTDWLAPAPVGVFTEAFEKEKSGGYAQLGPALGSAIRKLSSVGFVGRLHAIRKHREKVLHLLEQHRVRNLRVFGSAARREDRPDSDLDLVAEFDRGYDMLRDRIPLQEKLTELCESEIDLVPEHELDDSLRDKILREALPL